MTTENLASLKENPLKGLPGGLGFVIEAEHDIVSNRSKLFECNFCSSIFVTSASLRKHMFVHDEEETESELEENGNDAQLDGEQDEYSTGIEDQFEFEQEEEVEGETSEYQSKMTCPCCQEEFSNQTELIAHVATSHRGLSDQDEGAETAEISSYIETEDMIGNQYIENYSDDLQVEQYIEVSESTLNEDFQMNELNCNDYNDPAVYVTNGGNDLQNNTFDNGPGLGLTNPILLHSSLTISPSYGEFQDDTFIAHNRTQNNIAKIKPYPCRYCDGSFNTKIGLQRHSVAHANMRPHSCDLCGKNFLRKEHLTKHMGSVHSGTRFACKFCRKDISRKDHLIRHIRNVHPVEFQEVPPELSKSTADFPSWMYIERNLPLSRTTDKPKRNSSTSTTKQRKTLALCDMCPQAFVSLNELHIHQSQVHSDVRKYKCSDCPKAFKRREHLNKHAALHTGDRKFRCIHCNKNFIRSDALNDHIRRVHFELTLNIEYPCPYGCNKTFQQNQSLIRHIKTVHENEMEPSDDSFFFEAEDEQDSSFTSSCLDSLPLSVSLSTDDA